MMLVLASGLHPKGRSPSFARVPVPYSSAEGNDPRGRQAVYSSGSFPAYPPSSRITNTALRAIEHSLRSRPIVRRGVRYCVASAKTRRAPTRLDRPRPRPARRASPRQKPASRVLYPVRSAALLILAAAARRQGPHCSRGSRPSSGGLFPLTARFAAALPRASRSEPPRQVDITNPHINSVWIHQREFAS